MKKLKIKKNKKYVSLILAPHYSSKTRTYRLSNRVFKFARIAVVLVITALICQGLLSVYLIRKVTDLTAQRDSLAKSSYENLLKLDSVLEKNNLLQSSKTLTQEAINQYTEKYREITERYITSQLSVSRSDSSTNRVVGNFTEDIQELRNILAALNEIASIDSSTTVDFTDMKKQVEQFLDALPTFCPTQGNISDKFGYRVHPTSFEYKLHAGLDFAANYGADIMAAGSGTVIMAQTHGGYGKCVIIDHGNGIKTLYGHANELLVKTGQQVKKGMQIATVGSTGISTGPHLHFEVRLDDTPIDPLIYLDINNN